MLDIVPVSAGGVNEALCPGSGENNIPAIVRSDPGSIHHSSYLDRDTQPLHLLQ